MAPVPKKLIQLLQSLNSMPPVPLSQIVGCLDTKAVKLLSQLIHNVVFNTLHISKKDMSKIKRRMRKKSEDWNHIINPKGKFSKKRDILREQSGSGVLGAIFSIVAPILVGLLTGKK